MKNRSKNKHQSHSPACITYMCKDDEGGIHKEGQISLSCIEKDEATVSALAPSEIIVFNVELDFLYSEVLVHIFKTFDSFHWLFSYLSPFLNSCTHRKLKAITVAT